MDTEDSVKVSFGVEFLLYLRQFLGSFTNVND